MTCSQKWKTLFYSFNDVIVCSNFRKYIDHFIDQCSYISYLKDEPSKRENTEKSKNIQLINFFKSPRSL